MPRQNPEQSLQTYTATYVSSSGYTDSVARTSVSSYRSFSSVSTPNYAKRKNVPHGLPVNPHEMKITKRTLKMVREIITTKTGWSDYSDDLQRVTGIILKDPTYDLSHSEQAYTTALQKCQEKTNGMKINLAQAFAERRQVIDLVASTATAIARAISAMKKGNMKQAAKHLGMKDPRVDKGADIAKKWLALQYGVKPLLSDVYGAAEHLARRQTPTILRFTAKSTVSDSKPIIVNQSQEPKVTSSESGYSSSAEVMLSFYLGDQTARELNQLGITNPALLAWELLPYSFVADWFLPVGNYLGTLGYDNGLSFAGGYVVRFSKNQWTVNVASRTQVEPGSGTTTVLIGGEYLRSENVWLSRYPIAAPPSVPLPSFKNPLSGLHAANALALLRVACR